MEDSSTAVLLELFRKRLDVLNTRLEMLKQLSAPLKAPPLSTIPPAGLLRLPFEIRLQIYHYCIPRKRVIEVSMPRFYSGWPYEEVDRTLDFERGPDFEDNTLELEDTLSDREEALDLESDTMSLKGYNADWEGDYWDCNKNKNSIFLLSKQISEEALNILYGDNIFKL